MPFRAALRALETASHAPIAQQRLYIGGSIGVFATLAVITYNSLLVDVSAKCAVARRGHGRRKTWEGKAQEKIP